MNSTGNSDIQRIIAEQAAAMPLRRRAVDHTVAAVITVEGDLRFLGDTMHAVLNQTVLPGTVIVADCTGLTGQPVHSEVPLRDGNPAGAEHTDRPCRRCTFVLRRGDAWAEIRTAGTRRVRAVDAA